MAHQEDAVAADRHFSAACYIEHAFPVTLYLAWKYADDFEAGLMANTHLGGDNCHRGMVMGALIGAAVGKRGYSRAVDPGVEGASGVGGIDKTDNG